MAALYQQVLVVARYCVVLHGLNFMAFTSRFILHSFYFTQDKVDRYFQLIHRKKFSPIVATHITRSADRKSTLLIFSMSIFCKIIYFSGIYVLTNHLKYRFFIPYLFNSRRFNLILGFNSRIS
jgi:hypothetical protein